MIQWLSDLLDKSSTFFAPRKGLLPMLGILLIVINIVLQFFPGLGWIVSSNLLLQIGVIVAIFGFLLAQAL